MARNIIDRFHSQSYHCTRNLAFRFNFVDVEPTTVFPVPAAMATAKIKIAARLRPRLNGELDDESVKIIHTSAETGGSSSGSGGSGSVISVTNPRDPSQVFKFPFTSCYDQASNQEEIFQNDVQPMIDVVYSGVTVTIFAYGVTSSGKTHTMQGTKSDPGVIPRAIKAMFDKKSTITEYEVSLTVSYMEIYKDEVYDLLVTRENAPKLPVRENDAGMVFVANLTSEPISTMEEFDAIYNQATKNRSVGSTNLNRASSRSHAVLTIEAKMFDPNENKTLFGKINLVDLAGSENNKLTGNDPSRMAESSAINKSLSVLGQVVHALNQGASRIPYRNSKLTRILQDALGGSSVGLLICNLAPGIKFRQDTLNTLNFAVRTKNVENKPVVNERDNRPVPKPHFAAVAIQPPAARPAPAILQAISTAGSGTGAGPKRSRQSLVPVSRVPRASINGNGYQSFALPGAGAARRGFSEKLKEEDTHDRSGSLGIGLTEKEIDERISKAVEAEVARRLEERERTREREEQERRAREQEMEPLRPSSSTGRTKSRSPKKEQTLPSGVLTPLLKRHKDLDDELQSRLQELERKFERGNKEVQLADVLSPVSKKKTGRAYVALARAHSEKGDLQVALDLYRKAESYVPENVKLKERIIEIEWSVKNDKEFVPSPKPPRKAKKKKGKVASALRDDAAMDVDEESELKSANRRRERAEFGMELTNAGMDSPSTGKRPLDREEEDDAETPPKRQRRGGKAKAAVDVSSDDEEVPLAPSKTRRQLAS
ncbi:kinesin-like protein [Lyophyllum atratum]|nr:kinesin-like protein [Lyophyllum atratum]